MNRGLLWGFGGTAALSAWVLINPAPSTGASSANIVAAAPAPARAQHAEATGAFAESASTPLGNGAFGAAASAALPKHWPKPNVEPAVRNPFLATPPPTPKPVIAATVVAPPTAPPPPVANYRFWGRMSVAGGQRLTYVARRDEGSPTAVNVGSRLEDGWTVETIGDNAIVLVHAATQQRATLSIPPHGTGGQP